MRFFKLRQKGFTLFEVMIAVGIIAIFATLAYVGAEEVRKRTRDTKRMTDLGQLQLAFRLYKEAHGQFPPSDGEITNNGSLSVALAPYLSPLPVDPSIGNMSESGDSYRYYYLPAYQCDNGTYAVLLAQAVEQEGNKNWSAVCGGTGEIVSEEHANNGYAVILGKNN